MLEKFEDRSLLASLIGVYLDDSHVPEGAAAIFKLRADQPVLSNTEIHFHTIPGTATEDVDYTGIALQATIAAGQTEASVAVPTNTDAGVDPDETFALHVDAVYGEDASVDLWNNTRTVTIDDVPPPGSGGGGAGGGGTGGGTGGGETGGGGNTGGGTGGGETGGGGNTGGGTGGQPPPPPPTPPPPPPPPPTTGSGPPTFTSSASADCDENITSVMTVVAVDSQGNAITSYAITGGADAAFFQISGQDGQLAFVSAPNYEDPLDAGRNNEYLLQVRATDSTNQTATQDLTIVVLNVNERPTIGDLIVLGIDEDKPTGTVVGTMIAADPDANTTLTFSITGGNNGAFQIDAVTGKIRVADASKLDFDTKPEHVLVVTVSDGSLTADGNASISLLNVDEAPTLAAASFNMAENPASGAVIGTVAGTDPEGAALTYTIVSASPAGASTIDAATGELKVADAVKFDFEINPTLTVVVRASDGSLHADATMTIYLIDVNEAPTIAFDVFEVVENAANDTAVGSVTASDPDVGDSLHYRILSGNDGAFGIGANSGDIFVADGTKLDFETTNTYNLIIEVTDGALADSDMIVVVVRNVNESPAFAPTTYAVTRGLHLKAKEDVVAVSATDPDNNQTLTYAIDASTNTEGVFAIDVHNGQITLTKDALLTVADTYLLTVTATDDGSPASTPATVAVEITFKTSVGMTGDYHAVEGAQESAKIHFHRFSKTNTGLLRVEYDVNFYFPTPNNPYAPAEKGDLTPGTIANLFNSGPSTGFAEIQDGDSDSPDLSIDGVAGDGNEGVEYFIIEVTSLANYEIVPGSTKLSSNSSQSATSWSRIFVSEEYRLYARDNRLPERDDLVPDANPGIDPNDITQGGVGDCYLMAGLIAAARRDFHLIKDRIVADPDNPQDYVVRLYKAVYDSNGNLDAAQSRWQNYFVSSNLVRGDNMAKLSGDYDTVDGRIEIWPQVMEDAFAQLKDDLAGNGSGDSWLAIEDGFSGDLWVALTGHPWGEIGSLFNSSGQTNAAIADAAQSAFDTGKQVIVATFKMFGDKNDPSKSYTLSNGQTIAGNHAYVVNQIKRDPNSGIIFSFVLSNPWGPDLPVELPVEDLKNVVSQLQIWEN